MGALPAAAAMRMRALEAAKEALESFGLQDEVEEEPKS